MAIGPRPTGRIYIHQGAPLHVIHPSFIWQQRKLFSPDRNDSQKPVRFIDYLHGVNTDLVLENTALQILLT